MPLSTRGAARAAPVRSGHADGSFRCIESSQFSGFPMAPIRHLSVGLSQIKGRHAQPALRVREPVGLKAAPRRQSLCRERVKSNQVTGTIRARPSHACPSSWSSTRCGAPICTRKRAQSTGGMAAALHAEAEEAHGAVADPQNNPPALSVPAGPGNHPADKSHLAGLGELLCRGARESVLHLHPRLEKKVRRHLMRNSKRRGFGWRRWRRVWLYNTLGLFDGYQVHYKGATAVPVR
jgi:hypothetical protein